MQMSALARSDQPMIFIIIFILSTYPLARLANRSAAVPAEP